MNTKVLYIEKDRRHQQVVSKTLQKHGFEVLLAQDRGQGLEMAEAQKPHLVLLDMNLPRLEGCATAKELRQMPALANRPIVGLMTHHNRQYHELALAAGCTQLWPKPLNAHQLPKQVSALLTPEEKTPSQDVLNRLLEQQLQDVMAKLAEKQQEAEMVQAQLAKLEQMKSDFLVLISHELNTPLTAVNLQLEILKKRLQNANTSSLPAITQTAEKLTATVQRLNNVVEEMIHAAQVSLQTISFTTQAIHLEQVVAGLQADLAPICQSRHLTLEVEDLTPLPVLHADPGQLQTAVHAILENAIKYTPDGGRITVRGRVKEAMVELLIQDSGIGIPLAEQPLIFDKFYRVGSLEHHSTSKTAFQGGGLGLGLTVAKEIVQAHNGRLTVHSPGHDADALPGSMFCIGLPI